jgi:hypothetical protein
MAATAHAPAPMNDSELERRAFLDLLRMANTMVRAISPRIHLVPCAV